MTKQEEQEFAVREEMREIYRSIWRDYQMTPELRDECLANYDRMIEILSTPETGVGRGLAATNGDS